VRSLPKLLAACDALAGRELAGRDLAEILERLGRDGIADVEARDVELWITECDFTVLDEVRREGRIGFDLVLGLVVDREISLDAPTRETVREATLGLRARPGLTHWGLLDGLRDSRDSRLRLAFEHARAQQRQGDSARPPGPRRRPSRGSRGIPRLLNPGPGLSLGASPPPRGAGDGFEAAGRSAFRA
jgi:hypothetical protein